MAGQVRQTKLDIAKAQLLALSVEEAKAKDWWRSDGRIKMGPNLTYPIVLNPTINATLYQPIQPWYNAWIHEWSPILLGIAQVAVAVVLAWLTKKLWESTRDYSNQVRIQTDILTRNTELSERTLDDEAKNKQREALIKEMDKLVGPLYSRINDKQIFNPRGIGYGRYCKNSSSGEIDKQLYEEGAFWQGIAQYKYLASPDLRSKIDKYLEIKLGSTNVGKWDDPAYTTLEKSLTDAIKTRYNQIETELSRLEADR